MTSGRSARPATPVLRLTNAHKAYGGVRALRGAEFTIEQRGEVRTLLGENGSGKSTLLGILSGQIRPDAGELLLDGKVATFRHPQDAMRAGVVMVSQETSVVSSLTVAENVLLGRMPRSRLRIDRRRAHTEAARVLASLGLGYDTDTIVGTMRPDQRQMVEIARAMSMKARVLILDEPTSSLTNREVDGLFVAVDRLRAQGVSVVFVSHRLREVFRISDAITVLRDGQTVSAQPVDQFTTDSVVEAMVGSSGVREVIEVSNTARDLVVTPALRVRGLRLTSDEAGVDLDLYPGEVVGIAGLEGSGRSELLETIFGVRRVSAGTMKLGELAYAPRGPRHAIEAGVAYLPPDRKLSGLVLPMTVGENLAMAAHARRFALAPPGGKSQERAFATARHRMRLKASSSRVGVGTLSGGNQQKVALGKWLAVDAQVLLLDEPTRGVDVAAKADIHASVREVAAGGAAVLVSSSENPELMSLCDRIIVLFAGRVSGVVDRDSTNETQLMALAGGQVAEPKHPPTRSPGLT